MSGRDLFSSTGASAPFRFNPGEAFGDGTRPQRNLLSAHGDSTRRPSGAAQLLPRVLSALRGRGWVGGRALAAELHADLRALRDAASHSSGEVLGGNRGYALLAETPVAEVHAVIARHLSQSREQRKRALEIERAFHRIRGAA